MRVAVVAEIAIPGIGVRVEVDHPNRAPAGNRAEDGQRDQVIAAGGKGQTAGRAHRLIEPLDYRQRLHQVDRIHRRVAHVRASGKPVRRDPADVMRTAHEARHVADLARPVAGAGAVGRAAIPRHADERYVELRGIADAGQAHERRDRAKARHERRIDRLRELGGCCHALAVRTVVNDPGGRGHHPDSHRTSGAPGALRKPNGPRRGLV